ncbi:hypothetical protein ABF87_11655 [Nitrosomonas sp. JL21]|uniref:hypothetical protein n=1 Tax=Nitrosomonas sp. JL21 TaxID=153949 RepID=UPI00137017E4|nr:hypothetical protein [Nitrosomonas sp. JL21]MBL8496968.1 hypothetical protein [Nitrosomonas sp.]MCC7091839.1 hypothetical protein [Nitrosomonas sp.]MXS78598.1 hypothetical protein [Nitrosomonas sp. JL21]
MVSPLPQLLGHGLVFRPRSMLTTHDHCTVDSPSIPLNHLPVVPSNQPKTELGCPTVLQKRG